MLRTNSTTLRLLAGRSRCAEMLGAMLIFITLGAALLYSPQLMVRSMVATTTAGASGYPYNQSLAGSRFCKALPSNDLPKLGECKNRKKVLYSPVINRAIRCRHRSCGEFRRTGKSAYNRPVLPVL